MTQPKHNRHPRNLFVIKSEHGAPEIIQGPTLSENERTELYKGFSIRHAYTPPSPSCQSPEPLEPRPEVAVPRFCRLFAAEPDQPPAAALVELGLAMEAETADSEPDGDSVIPAGFTYFGQFVDHDITRDKTEIQDQDPIQNTTTNHRSPGLDLDSVYRGGELDDNRKRFKVGLNANTDSGEPGGPIEAKFRNDLPRNETVAAIGDPRNDENLAVAQTHLAFLKYHNALQTNSPSEEFHTIRQRVVRDYQAIVLTDFLPRIVCEEALASAIADAQKGKRKLYTSGLDGCMPVEFSAAAYRLGHSMVRPVYEWNRVFNSSGAPAIPATMELLFEFSNVSGRRTGPEDAPFFGKGKVPSNWIIDWTRFYDGLGRHPNEVNRARQLDTHLALSLKNLPEFTSQSLPSFLVSLASRNLLRGRQLKLPSGQAVAEGLRQRDFSFTPLSVEEIVQGAHGDLLLRHGLEKQTPLWFYILREAKMRGGGNKLGPVGSILVAETMVGLLMDTPDNILNSAPIHQFSMANLLKVVANAEPGFLNPLG